VQTLILNRLARSCRSVTGATPEDSAQTGCEWVVATLPYWVKWLDVAQFLESVRCVLADGGHGWTGHCGEVQHSEVLSVRFPGALSTCPSSMPRV
jgi:hypothetical protein